MNKSESLDKLIPSLIKAQAKFDSVHKHGFNPFHKNKYALFEDVFNACFNQLIQNDLTFTQTLRFDGNTNILITTLFHSSGQFISSELALLNKAGTDQGLGSSITYAKRYALIAILGLPTSDEDDDGNLASKAIAKQKSVHSEEYLHDFNREQDAKDPFKTKVSDKLLDQLKDARTKAGYSPEEVKSASTVITGKDDPTKLTETEMKFLLAHIKKNPKDKK